MIQKIVIDSSIAVENGYVVCRVNEAIEFRDSVQHWKDGVVRLLDQEESALFAFVQDACEQLVNKNAFREDVIQTLKSSWKLNAELPETQVAPKPPTWLNLGGNESCWLTNSVRDSAKYGIAWSSDVSHAWLAQRENGMPAGLESVSYEADYFEGQQSGVGYGSYASQAGWRLEKAQRQCREVGGLMKFFGIDETKAKILDIGSGYGYFRKACTDIGWSTQGVEVSKHACNVAKEMYELDTHCGTLDSFSEKSSDHFDAIVMWDFIEHVENPIVNLEIARNLLAEGGLLFIRTPNLDAVEFEVFGSSYHSLKREHLNLFSATSLSRSLVESGLCQILTLTESHLLSGFVRAEIPMWTTTLRGSDLFSVSRRISSRPI